MRKPAPPIPPLQVRQLDELAVRVRQRSARYLNAIELVKELVAGTPTEPGEHMDDTPIGGGNNGRMARGEAAGPGGTQP